MNSSVDDDIEVNIDKQVDEKNDGKPTTFPAAVKELGIALFNRNPKKTSNYTYENEQGLTEIDIILDYHKNIYQYDFTVLKELANSKIVRTVSVKGYGIEKLVELVKGINIAFEQSEGLEAIRRSLRR